jgi:beta-lactam-binding protein with PASTA domain
MLKGDSLNAAKAALGKAHCKLGKVTVPHGHHRALVVAAQSVTRGTQLPSGAAIAVRLTLSRTKHG